MLWVISARRCTAASSRACDPARASRAADRASRAARAARSVSARFVSASARWSAAPCGASFGRVDFRHQGAAAHQIGVGRLQQALVLAPAPAPDARRDPRRARAARSARSVQSRISAAIASCRRRRSSASWTRDWRAARASEAAARRSATRVRSSSSWLSRSGAGARSSRAASASRIRVHGLRFAGGRGGPGLPAGRSGAARARPRAVRPAASRCAGAVERLTGLPGGLDGLHFVGGGAADGVVRFLGLGTQMLDGFARLGGVAFQVAEAVLFGQPPGGGGRRFGGGGETVPAPEIALARDQPLAGLQARAKPQAVGLADDADLPQAALQRRGGVGDGRRASRDAVRQRRIAFARARIGPMGGSRRVGRGVEIVAERRAERRLVALLDGDLVERRRPQVARSGRRRAWRACALRFRAAAPCARPRSGAGAGGSRPRGRRPVPRAPPSTASSACAHRVLGDGHVFAQQVDGRRHRPRRLESAATSRSRRSFSEAKRAARSISSRIGAFERGAAGIEIGGLRLQRAQRGLGFGQFGLDDPQPLFALGAGIGGAFGRSARSRRPPPGGARRSPARRCAAPPRGRDRG